MKKKIKKRNPIAIANLLVNVAKVYKPKKGKGSFKRVSKPSFFLTFIFDNDIRNI